MLVADGAGSSSTAAGRRLRRQQLLRLFKWWNGSLASQATALRSCTDCASP